MEIIKFWAQWIEVLVWNWSWENPDVWLETDWMSELFERDRTVIWKHIKTIYKEWEVWNDSFREEIVTTHKNGKAYKTKKKYYNLDVILSVWYKINGKRWTEFRKWANDVLGKYLKKGYIISDKLMLEAWMSEVISLIWNAQRHLIEDTSSSADDISEILGIIKDYWYSFSTLQNYDERNFTLEWEEKNTKYTLEYWISMKIIWLLRDELIKKGEATELFGQEKTPGSLESILGNVFNSFSWGDAYPSLEEKAAQLLYFIIKDHPFNDGNKRTASFLFSVFLQKNDFHLKLNWERKINDNALAILVLLIAESDPKEREIYIKLLVNILRKR